MTTLTNQFKVAVALPAFHRLTIVMAASSTAIVERYLGEALLEKTTLSASQTKVFGEYLVGVVAKITCLTGSLDYSASQNTGPAATETNDDAPAGAIGEFKSTTVAVGAAIPVTTATPVDVCTLALTPGDWDVSAVVDRDLAGVTATQFAAGISLTADTLPTQPGGSGLGSDAAVTQNATFGTTVTGAYSTPIPPVRVSIAAATTLHLVVSDIFSAGTLGAFGTLRARRAR